MKKFDSRNTFKKQLHRSRGKFYVKTREVRYAHLGVNIGYEQDGIKEDFTRPVFVLKKIGNMFIVLPMTTKGKDNEFYFTLSQEYFNKQSRVILSQIRAIDKARFTKIIGRVSNSDFSALKEKLKALML